MPPDDQAAGLKGLRDIQLPVAVSWMPQTAAWYVLAALAGVLLLAAALIFWMKWKRNAYRREALRELGAIAAECGDETGRLVGLARLPELLRRTALAASPREEIARLTSDEWLGYLERTAPGCGLGGSNGRLLLSLAYAPQSHLAALNEADARMLISSTGTWIRRHHAAV